MEIPSDFQGRQMTSHYGGRRCSEGLFAQIEGDVTSSNLFVPDYFTVEEEPEDVRVDPL